MNKLRQYLCNHKNYVVLREYNASTPTVTTTATLQRCCCVDCLKVFEKIKKV